jgi:hypothetical protein
VESADWSAFLFCGRKWRWSTINSFHFRRLVGHSWLRRTHHEPSLSIARIKMDSCRCYVPRECIRHDRFWPPRSLSVNIIPIAVALTLGGRRRHSAYTSLVKASSALRRFRAEAPFLVTALFYRPTRCFRKSSWQQIARPTKLRQKAMMKFYLFLALAIVVLVIIAMWRFPY